MSITVPDLNFDIHNPLSHLNEDTAEKLFFGQLTAKEMIVIGIRDPEKSGFKVKPDIRVTLTPVATSIES